MYSQAMLNSFYAGILSRDLVPVAFYPYTTFVQNRILEGERLEPLDPFNILCMEIKRKVLALGVQWDNKVAIELKIEYPSALMEHKSGTMFLGYCDNKWSLGLSIWSPDANSSTYQSCIVKFK